MSILNALVFMSMFLVPSSLALFPVGSCKKTMCDGSPYNFVWTYVDQVAGQFCFTLDNNNAQSDCASAFRQQTTKFVIKTQPMCSEYFKQVTINGVKKGGGVFFDLYNGNSEAELRVTSMNYTNTTIAHVTFCIFATAPCNNLQTFCGGSTCLYSLFNPFTHQCCPVCFFGAFNNAFSPPPPINSSPPPQINSSPPPQMNSQPPPPPQMNSSPPPPPSINSSPPPPPLCTTKPVNTKDLNCSCTCSVSM